MVRGNERKNLTLKRGALKFAKFLRVSCLLLPVLWMIFFMMLRVLHIEFPRTVDITILACVIAVSALLGIIDLIFTRKKCRCPYCGKPWSMMKYGAFRRGPLDLINNTKEYTCYNCKEDIEIV